MANVFKATKNQKVEQKNLTNNSKTYKATNNQRIEYSEKSDKALINEYFKEYGPLPQGPLTPSNMRAAVVKGLKDKKERDALKFTIPSVTYDAVSANKNGINVDERLGGKTLSEYVTLEKAKEKQKNNQPLTLSEKLALKNEPIKKPDTVPYIPNNQFGMNSNAAINRTKSKIKREKTFYYSSLPNGTVKTTNPKNKKWGLTFDNSIDWKYEYINDLNGTREIMYAQSLRSGSRSPYRIYDNMSKREIGIYNYLYQTEGKDKAEEFLDFIELDLDARLNEEVAETSEMFAEKSPVFSSIISPAITVVSAGEQIVNYGEFLVTGKMKTNKSATAVSTIRSTVSDKVDWEIGNWDAFDFVYNTVMSGVDSAIMAPFGTAGAVALGLSAAGSTTNDILQRGGDSYQAFFGGVAAGVFEGFFEKFSIGQLNAMKEGAVTGFKDYALNLVKSMGVNFSEEAATETANILYDYAMNGGISNYNIMIQEFMANGDSLENAKKKAAKKLGMQVLEAGASGALMGFGFASITSASSYKKSSSIGKVIAANETEGQIIDVALSMDDNSKSHKMALEIQQSGKMSTAKIGGLAVQVISDISEQKGVVIKTAVSERAEKLGIDVKTTQKLTNYLTEVATNGKIETVNAEDIGKNVKAQQIITEIKNGEVWTEDMNVQLSSLEKAETVIRNAVTFNTAQNSQLQLQSDGGEVSLSEAESQLLNTPDAELTPQQRAEKQSIIERLQNGKNNAQNPDLPNTQTQSSEGDTTPQNSNIEVLTVRKKNKQRRHTTAKEQAFIKRIAKALGVKVEFENITAELLRSYGYDIEDGAILPDGYYNRNTKTIHIGFSVYNPVTFVFKHELTHFGEGTVQYEKFVKAVRNSRAFKKWLKNKTGFRKSENLEDAYLLMIAKPRGYTLNENGELSEADRQELMCEVIADFVGDCIFDSDTSMLDRMMSELDENERNVVFKHIQDFFSYLLRKLQGEKQLTFEIMQLEKEFNKMLNEAVHTKKETPTDNGGDLQFSISKKRVATKRRTRYNEYATNVMQWAYSATTKNGDVKLFNNNGKSFVLNMATEDGYIEIASGNFKEVSAEYERIHGEKDTSFYEDINEIRTQQRRSMWDIKSNDFGKNGSGNSQQIGSQELQDNTTGDAEHLRASDKGKYVNDEADLEEVDSYSEEQYNNFGWVRANNVLARNEYATLLSRYADYKHNKDKYPTTRFGEAVIFSFDHPSVIMYVKGTIENPEITKVLKIDDELPVVIQETIQKEILSNERNKVSLPYENVTIVFGERVFTLNKRRDFASFQEYERGREGKVGKKDSISNRGEQDATGSQKQNNATSEAGLNKPAFSMPSETDELLEMYESGEITKAQYKAAMDKYWDDMLAEMEDSAWAQRIADARYANQLKKRIRRQNEQLARRRSEISKEITAQREERASKQKNIEHIRKTVSRIDKMLRTNSNTKHVPEELKEEIASFISIFVENDRSPFNKKDLRNIQLAYSYALNQSVAMDESNGFDEDILRDIEILREKLEGKTLRDLDLYETLLIRNIVDNLSHIIKQTNEMFIAGKSQQIHEVGHIAMQELTTKESKKANAVTNALDDTIVYSNMTPIYFFDKIGGIFKTLFSDVVEAQNKWFKNVENGKAFIRQIKEKYNYSQWADDKLEFTTENGDRIKITREQAMLLYATAKREYKNTSQQAKHLFSGGVVIEPSAKKLKDLVNKFKSSSAKGRERIIEAFSEEIDARAHKITYKDMVEVGNWLTKEQVAYVNAFVEYLSTDMAVLGNEVSMELYGIRKYNEDYYIPYNSAQNFLYSQPGVTNEARLKHQSFTKNTVYGANNPLILSDFSTVCADHINRMCMYNALTLPLENMNKIFNYGTSGEEVSTKNIKSEIERVYGKSAVTYLKTFIEDMNGNVRASQTDKAINRWISLFKKGAVFASASVVVQQPSAIVRAMAYIKPKYFRSTTLKLSERDYQQCVRYASVAGIKEMGRFDTGVGATTTNWLLQETPKGVKNKVKALLSSDSTYRDDKLSYFAAKADEMTWAHIWAAVKAEIADTTDLKVGSKEFFETCGKRFTEVINYTQVYDSTISRSQIMRSKSTGAQMLTAFMSEPTVSLNLLMRAATEAKSGTKQGKQFAVNAVAAFVGSVVLNSLLKSFVTAARDDDEDETYLEKYVGDFVGNFVSDVSPLGMIPFVKDIVSIFEGYTVERADMNLFSDLAQSIKTLNSDSKSDYEKFESILGSLAAFLGLPVKNMLRDGRSVYNLYKDFFVNDNKTDWQGIKSSVFDYSNSDKYEALVKAAEKDDEEEYQAIYKDLIDSGKDDSDIKSGIKKVYRNSSEVKKDTEKYIKELNGNETFNNLDEEDRVKLESNIASALATEKTVKAIAEKPDRFDELYAAFRNNKSNYKRLKQQMIDEGMSESLIEDGLEMARIAYMKSVGIDVSEYLLYKIATSKKYADTDNSGGVSNAEKKAAVREMDIDQKIKNYFLNQHK